MIKPKIFLIHFAGGNIYSFQFLHEYLNADFELIPLELPGRGKRIHEPLLYNYPKAIEDLFDQIIKKISPGRDIIYGHSLGATLGFFVTAKLELAGIHPKKLIVSGNSGPSENDKSYRYNLPDTEFKSMLKDMGGMPDEFFEQEDLYEFYEPILRSDFELSEVMSDITNVSIHTPILAVMGTEESGVGQIENWKRFTSGNFEAAIIEGNHFFIRQHPQKLKELFLNP